ncbi:neuronal acetylcholine receptor subunit alpha-7-like isoform X3 [Argiope bruennichi]|uniref:neuronal acetylcholine receptor subunit alpha-7-like isoform X3 n=1 Tax=Argiope bruennichi TaxID=94029 RepID=UPI002494F4E8|nr:neuronal acetylcholine receptor subunit alpha-7-like isoform X3 [Argiope bruennichi]
MEKSAIRAQLFFSLIILCLPLKSEQGPHEKRLLNKLLNDYNVLERPVANESEPLLLSFGLTLQQIIDVDEKNQIVVSNIWLNLEWVDVNLRWNASEFGGIQDLRIPPHKIWKPDVLMYNSADEKIDSTFPTNVVVRNNGSCTYIPPGIFKSTCKIDITWFPFDDQKCEMKFGSWTYDGFQLDLRLANEDGGDLSTYITNGEWILIGLPGVRNEIFYACCPEPYVDITFTIHIRRRTLYYGFNLIIPCVLISSMTLLGFTLPPDSGEKLTLGVTILLSLSVFQMLVTETLPPSSDAVSIIGTYFACIMIMVAFSVVMTVVVLNYHHRNSDTHEMPEYIRTIFLLWLPWILRMHRPAKISARLKATSSFTTSGGRSSRLSAPDLKERSSKSLLANVLDIDDDFRLQHGPNSNAGASSAMSGGDSACGYVQLIGPSVEGTPTTTLHGATGAAAANPTSCLSSQRELAAILREVRYITKRMRDDDATQDIISEWKFAGMVVDRVCFILFTAFTVISTCVCLFSAPHLVA